MRCADDTLLPRARSRICPLAAKICPVAQVYVALLRAYQPEAKHLVRKALDILMPALPKRLPAGDHRYPTWIKWTKKIIVEEGHLVPQLIHIWSVLSSELVCFSLRSWLPCVSEPPRNLIVRHPTLFYSSRTQFVPQMYADGTHLCVCHFD